jgi:hypothetical protein
MFAAGAREGHSGTAPESGWASLLEGKSWLVAGLGTGQNLPLFRLEFNGSSRLDALHRATVETVTLSTSAGPGSGPLSVLP